MAIEIDNRLREQNRTVHTLEEKNDICRFMQNDQPYSLMCELYIRKYITWAISQYGTIGIVNPAVEFRVEEIWSVQLEGMGIFVAKNFLGTGIRFRWGIFVAYRW